jgi:hypothetical protein
LTGIIRIKKVLPFRDVSTVQGFVRSFPSPYLPTPITDSHAKGVPPNPSSSDYEIHADKKGITPSRSKLIRLRF